MRRRSPRSAPRRPRRGRSTPASRRCCSALPDDGLAALGIPAAAQRRRAACTTRGRRDAVARFDFLREGDAFRVVELNAETPFFLVESFREQGRRALAAGYADPNAGECERLADALAAALAPLARGARVGVTATNVHREDIGTALFLRDLIAARIAAEVVFVPVHELAVIDGSVCDEHGPLDVLYRCYPLEHFAADAGGPALFDAVARGACRLLNPPSALALQSKATQALIWGLAEQGAYFDAARARGDRARLLADLPRPARRRRAGTSASRCWAARAAGSRSSTARGEVVAQGAGARLRRPAGGLPALRRRADPAGRAGRRQAWWRARSW